MAATVAQIEIYEKGNEVVLKLVENEPSLMVKEGFWFNPERRLETSIAPTWLIARNVR